MNNKAKVIAALFFAVFLGGNATAADYAAKEKALAEAAAAYHLIAFAAFEILKDADAAAYAKAKAAKADARAKAAAANAAANAAYRAARAAAVKYVPDAVAARVPAFDAHTAAAKAYKDLAASLTK